MGIRSKNRFLKIACVTVALACICGHDAVRAGSHVKPPTVTAFAEPSAGAGPVVGLINSARHSIKLEVYEMTDRDVFTALEGAHGRRVSVQVLLEQHPYGGDQYAKAAYSQLQSAGISVRWANESQFTYTHEKALEVDGETAGIFTFNLTNSGLGFNREFGVIDHDSRDAASIATIFACDWKRAQHCNLNLGDLVVSPLNSRSVIQRFIDGARHTLLLYQEEVSDPSVITHLVAAAKRGVVVRLITSSASQGVKQLRSSRVDVRILTVPYIHAKAIIADSVKLFVGSENLSTTSLDLNREVGILTSQRPAIAVVASAFEHDWAQAKPY